jgi:GTP cyclohydrolase IA
LSIGNSPPPPPATDTACTDEDFDSSGAFDSDQTSAPSMDSNEATAAPAAADPASASAPVITITNPQVCEATRARLLHRKRPCLSSSSDPSALQNGDDATSSTKASIVTAESRGTNSGSDAAGSGGRVVACPKPACSCASTSAAVTQSGDTLQNHQPDGEDEKLERMMEACKTILQCMGEDPNRNGLVKTPERWAKALLYMTSGYQMSPERVTNGAIFEENHDEMVVVRNMNIHSLCEHHMLPFTGVVHVGYIPNGKIVGLSKLARIAELYARRLQVQERLTRQIADAVVEMVQPLGVAVVVECTHFCMVMRGVQQASAVTTTSSVRGCFESNPKTRAEFFSILHNGRIKMC